MDDRNLIVQLRPHWRYVFLSSIHEIIKKEKKILLY